MQHYAGFVYWENWKYIQRLFAEELLGMVKDRVNCAVFYGRTGNATVEMIKKVLDSGEIGHLALYKEDWLHHYPVWNDWATDPEKTRFRKRGILLPFHYLGGRPGGI